MTAELEVWRCPRCSRILAKLVLTPGSMVQIKCACNRVNTLDDTVPLRVRTYVGALKAPLTR